MVDENEISGLSEQGLKGQPRRKQIIPQMVVGLIILISGIIVGSGGTVALLKDRVVWIHHHPKMEAADIAKEIGSQYGLTNEQTQKVEQIFRDMIQDRTAVHQEFEAKMEAEHQQLVTEMKAVLLPEQFERWHKDFEAKQEQHKKMVESRKQQTK